jgi:hypothetical protein
MHILIDRRDDRAPTSGVRVTGAFVASTYKSVHRPTPNNFSLQFASTISA